MIKITGRRIVAAMLAALGMCSGLAMAASATVRLDYQHSGNAKSEHYAMERVVIEPLPWPGNPKKAIDDTDRGNNKFEVRDAATGALLYSRGFSTVFAEWQSTDEAAQLDRSFQESLRFPKPEKPVKVSVLKRDAENRFVPVWSVQVDTDAQGVIRKQPDSGLKPIKVHYSGPSEEKVDLLILGDGYTAAELQKFEADAKRLTEHLFSVAPFKQRANDFNVWALAVPTPESGISRPSTGVYHASALGSSYDIFGSERYVLTLDNAALRGIAQNAPYEFIEILVNNKTYGGGGIFGQFSTAAAGSDWSNYLFVHEFGHHFAGLADEYYTSPVAYQSTGEFKEPWEPNATALKDPSKLKWKKYVNASTPLPTPWPKQVYDDASRAYQKKRAELRAQNRPESEMNELFTKDLARSTALLNSAKHRHDVGAFEGANYESTGYFRPEMQCIMFDRSEKFCHVCHDAIINIIDLYSR